MFIFSITVRSFDAEHGGFEHHERDPGTSITSPGSVSCPRLRLLVRPLPGDAGLLQPGPAERYGEQEEPQEEGLR